MLLEKNNVDFEESTGCKILPVLQDKDPRETSGDKFLPETTSSQGHTHNTHLETANPASSQSKNRISSTATYQQYILAPKIPSSSGANQTDTNFLATTT